MTIASYVYVLFCLLNFYLFINVVCYLLCLVNIFISKAVKLVWWAARQTVYGDTKC